MREIQEIERQKFSYWEFELESNLWKRHQKIQEDMCKSHYDSQGYKLPHIHKHLHKDLCISDSCKQDYLDSRNW